MRLSFIEHLAETTMKAKGISRNAALLRYVWLFAIFGIAFIGTAMFAPIEDVFVSRRSSSSSLSGLLTFLGVACFGVAVLCHLSQDTERDTAKTDE